MTTPMERALALLEQAAELLAKHGKPDATEQTWRWNATLLITQAGQNRYRIETIDLYGDDAWHAFIADNDGLELLNEAEAIRCAKSPGRWTIGGGAAPLFCIRLHPARAA